MRTWIALINLDCWLALHHMHPCIKEFARSYCVCVCLQTTNVSFLSSHFVIYSLLYMHWVVCMKNRDLHKLLILHTSHTLSHTQLSVIFVSTFSHIFLQRHDKEIGVFILHTLMKKYVVVVSPNTDLCMCVCVCEWGAFRSLLALVQYAADSFMPVLNNAVSADQKAGSNNLYDCVSVCVHFVFTPS